MALIGSLNSGISALRNFARGLEVIGNNIANVNSVAFKGSRTKYTDSFSQFLKQPSTSPADGNGSNSASSQIGLGTQISGIQTSFLQGALTTTNQNTDLAISGAGFFQVRNAQNNQTFATRAGDFRTDDQGYITTNDGYRLQGLSGGTISYQTAIDPEGNTVFLPTVSPAQATGDIRIDFNPTLDNGRLTNSPYLVDATGAPVLDAAGAQIPAFQPLSAQALTSEAFTVDGSGNLLRANGSAVLDGAGNPIAGTAGNYLINSSGNVVLGAAGDTYYLTPDSNGALLRADGTAVMDATGAVAATGGAGFYVLDATGNLVAADTPVQGEAGEYLFDTAGNIILAADGSALEGPTGSYLRDSDGLLSLNSDGEIIAAPTDAEVTRDVPKMIAFKFRGNGDVEVALSNGSNFIGGRVLLMDFSDPTALVSEGANLFSGFDAAGVIGNINLSSADNTPGSYGLGVIKGGSLELSNVDLTEQFAELITTQRSFQAGSRIITVSDDILQEVVNLKR